MSGLYYLEYHDAAKNSHKFYAGNPQTGDVLYGRVGAKGTLKHYGFNKVVDMKYEKQKKGYKSATIPQYVLDTLRGENDAPVKKPRSPVRVVKVTPIQRIPKVAANRGLLNWFGSLGRTE